MRQVVRTLGQARGRRQRVLDGQPNLQPVQCACRHAGLPHDSHIHPQTGVGKLPQSLSNHLGRYADRESVRHLLREGKVELVVTEAEVALRDVVFVASRQSPDTQMPPADAERSQRQSRVDVANEAVRVACKQTGVEKRGRAALEQVQRSRVPVNGRRVLRHGNVRVAHSQGTSAQAHVENVLGSGCLRVQRARANQRHDNQNQRCLANSRHRLKPPSDRCLSQRLVADPLLGQPEQSPTISQPHSCPPGNRLPGSAETARTEDRPPRSCRRNPPPGPVLPSRVRRGLISPPPLW